LTSGTGVGFTTFDSEGLGASSLGRTGFLGEAAGRSVADLVAIRGCYYSDKVRFDPTIGCFTDLSGLSDLIPVDGLF
jgi:hypothetical protein